MNLDLINTNIYLFVQACNGILISICQLLALVVIAIGVIRALFVFLRETLLQYPAFQVFQKSRLMMGYAFSLGLSFLIGASILKTTISSKWDDIAQLVVTIAIRTALNLLLERATRIGQREMKTEKELSLN